MPPGRIGLRHCYSIKLSGLAAKPYSSDIVLILGQFVAATQSSLQPETGRLVPVSSNPPRKQKNVNSSQIVPISHIMAVNGEPRKSFRLAFCALCSMHAFSSLQPLPILSYRLSPPQVPNLPISPLHSTNCPNIKL